MPDAGEFSSGCIVLSKSSRRRKLLRAGADRDTYRTHCALRLRSRHSPAHVYSLSLLMLVDISTADAGVSPTNHWQATEIVRTARPGNLQQTGCAPISLR